MDVDYTAGSASFYPQSRDRGAARRRTMTAVQSALTWAMQNENGGAVILTGLL